MELSTKFVKMQLALFKPFVNGASVEVTRKGQDVLGELMATVHRSGVRLEDVSLGLFDCAWAVPEQVEHNGVVLYLHGGGYMAGDLKYAKGFATTLAHKCKVKVFCAAYRLAPEFPFPAAVDDALAAYLYLLEQGYPAEKIVLSGESAGGGLIYALTLKLRELGQRLPAGLVAISPWSDLTASGESYRSNREADPSMSLERLNYYADLYAKDFNNPLVSPVFASFSGFPPSLIFVGGDEIMLDDARSLHRNLLRDGASSVLCVAPGMWHGYLLYCVKETKDDYVKLQSFLNEVLV